MTIATILSGKGSDVATVPAGTAVRDAVALLAEQGIGIHVLGHPVVRITRDDTGPNPDKARQLAQELVVRDKVDILTGVLAGAAFGPNIIGLFRTEAPDVPRAFAAADPYVVQGLVTRWWVRPWTTVVGPLSSYRPGALTSPST